MKSNDPKHLLSELGVLNHFSIGRRIPAEKVKDYKQKIKKLTKNRVESDRLLKKFISMETEKWLQSERIPGVVEPGNQETKIVKGTRTERDLIELSYFASIVSKKLEDKKAGVFNKCYFVNVLVNMMRLSEEDFEKFHRLFEKLKNGEIDTPEDYSGGETPSL